MDKKECIVPKTFSKSSDKFQKGVKSFRIYHFQNYSSGDPKWNGILPTPTLQKSCQVDKQTKPRRKSKANKRPKNKRNSTAQTFSKPKGNFVKS